MGTLVGSIMRAATRNPDEPLNILTFPTHERFETGLAKTGHNFYAWRGPHIKEWNSVFAPVPTNYVLLNSKLGDNQIPVDLDIDFIISQNKFGQFPLADKLAGIFHVPLISLEHTLPIDEAMKYRFGLMRGDVNVFISEYSRDVWGWNKNNSTVIHHGIDVDLFSPDGTERKPQVLSVVNDFVNRDWCCGFNLWKEVTAGLPVKLLGDTPGLSKAAQDTAELVSAYRECGVFLNTSLVSPIPTVLLEAMSCGCAIVSTANCMIPDIIEHGKNGLISNKPEDLRKYLEQILESKNLRNTLGEAARQTIVDRFHINRFVDNWNKLFQQAKEMIFTGDR